MNTGIRRLLLVMAVLCLAECLFGQVEASRRAIDSIASHAKGIVGVAVLDLKTGDTVTIRGHSRFPMQSVYKFPIALAVLDRVDKGELSLSQMIHIKKAELLPGTWSPIRDRHPAGDVILTLDSLLFYTVSFSDNNGCDKLLRMLGGPKAVDRYVHSLGITEMGIAATEEQMHGNWEVQFTNWSTPLGMAQLLQMLFTGSKHSPESREYLWRIMTKTATGPRRLKGLLPEGTVVAHKTGSSGTNARGITAATNDVGIIVVPDGHAVAVAVFVSESDATESRQEDTIAAIARAVWDAMRK